MCLDKRKGSFLPSHQDMILCTTHEDPGRAPHSARFSFVLGIAEVSIHRRGSRHSAQRMSTSTFRLVATSVLLVVLTQILLRVLREAYDIRMKAINEYGRVIHEFDPYFNYRATEYLYEHGWQKFTQWFDYKVWYPLGRPVGTTIYPGMQVTSVFIKNHVLKDWSINDICCFVPAWFGAFATLLTGLLAFECSRPSSAYGCLLQDIPGINTLYSYVLMPLANLVRRMMYRLTGSQWGFAPSRGSTLTPLMCGLSAAGVMAIVPAHLLRSVGGGYDNESIAMAAMVGTFYCWTRSLRDNVSLTTTMTWGVLTGIAYFYMVAAWGGYVFVLNVVGVHAVSLVLLGRYSTKLHRAYSIFYALGTFLATRVPVVGMTPLKSLEQIGPLLAFFGMQLIEVTEIRRRRKILCKFDAWKLRIAVFAGGMIVALLVSALLWPTGYFGPISSRVRGLFVKHTKTGNPLVDSVAEHQAASPEAYFQYLHYASYLAPIGVAMICCSFWNDSSSFLLVYAVTAYFFSHKMVRLILLTAPIASVTAGIALGRVGAWGIGACFDSPFEFSEFWETEDDDNAGDQPANTPKPKRSKATPDVKDSSSQDKTADALYSRIIRLLIVVFLGFNIVPFVEEFYHMAHEIAGHISHPTIIQKAQKRDGEMVIIDDYRQAYFWLRDNTPEDARIMAWWDYGYQITGISNRTTIADGNTWNHEHIALLGRTLTAPEKEAHRIARHMADYVLVWAGGGGDDLAKSPHLRRIANSVYRGLCKDPMCSDFGFYQDRTPMPDMAGSLLYKLVGNGLQPGVEVDRNRFREVFKTKYGKVRIYKIQSVSNESKNWVADPSNRLCDAPGSWFCRGQYPPALEKVLKEKRDFKQLEDFNRKISDEEADEYNRQYMENVHKAREKSERRKHGENLQKDQRIELIKLEDLEIDLLNEHWENNEATTLVWQLISENAYAELAQLLSDQPMLAHMRSEDGRGPMWWAYEFKRKNIIGILKQLGVSEERTDANGIRPIDLNSK